MSRRQLENKPFDLFIVILMMVSGIIIFGISMFVMVFILSILPLWTNFLIFFVISSSFLVWAFSHYKL